MSNQEAEVAPGGAAPSEGAAERGAQLKSLAEAVERAVAAMRESRRRAATAEERAKQNEELLRQFVGGERDPVALTGRISELEAENEMLRARMDKGRREVDDVLARIRFLENEQ